MFPLLGLFSSVEETQVSVQRKTTMLEAAESSTLFPCENQGKENHLCEKQQYLLHCCPVRVE
jgi:hypothetical protein